MKRLLTVAWLLLAVPVACSSVATSVAPPAAADAAVDTDAGALSDASSGAAADSASDSGVLSGKCADTFGNALTAGFGRLDGVVYAIQKPSDTQCAIPNKDHVVVQVLMNGAVYRMVVNVQSDRPGADPRVRWATIAHALPEPAFAEGWHAGVALDYVATLGASDALMQPLAMADLVAKIAGEVKVGDAVSVYATSGAGRPESTHLVHRNKTNEDGAIVLSPNTATPTILLFAFDGQSF